MRTSLGRYLASQASRMRSCQLLPVSPFRESLAINHLGLIEHGSTLAHSSA